MNSAINHKQTARKGFSVIEILIACAIIAGGIFSFMAVVQKSVQLSDRALKQTQANFLLEEGAEVVKLVRDNQWSNISSLTLGADYYPAWNGAQWSLTQTPSAVGEFTRTVVLENVNRDANDDIAQSGTLDSGTRKVTVTVSWNDRGTSVSKAISFYISDIFNS